MEELDEWSIEADQVNRVQMERTAITASKIREATRGDPARCTTFCTGWPAEGNISEQLKIYYSKYDEFTVEDGCIPRGTRVVFPAKYQAAVFSALHLNHPGMIRMKSLVRDCHAC